MQTKLDTQHVAVIPGVARADPDDAGMQRCVTVWRDARAKEIGGD